MEQIRIEYLDGTYETINDLDIKEISLVDNLLMIEAVDQLQNRVVKAINTRAIKNYEVTITNTEGVMH